MDTVVVIVLVVIVGVALYFFLGRGREKAKSESAAGAAPSLENNLDLDTVKPGDVIALWSGKESLVERVVAARESLPGRVTNWKWVFLEGGQVLAVTPVGSTLYTSTEIVYQGTEPFEMLTGEVERGGALKTFEARVRESATGSNPVYFEYNGQRYRMLSTGTFAVPDQPVPETEVWRDVQADEGQNVYFRMAGQDGAQVLGIWTTHIALLIGQALSASDVREIYRTGR